MKHPVPIKKWTRFRKGLCDTCWAGCCHRMPVQVSVKDLIRLGLLTEVEAAGSLETAIRRLRAEGILKRRSPEKWVWVLEQKPGGDCLFLNEARRCTVYAKRPEICRRFPRIGPRPGSCPYLPK